VVAVEASASISPTVAVAVIGVSAVLDSTDFLIASFYSAVKFSPPLTTAPVESTSIVILLPL
jgi:hypothetical protein